MYKLKIVILILSITQLFANTGEYGAQFLNIGINPRSNGMGQSIMAAISDPSAMVINPAGIARVKSKEFFLSHRFGLVDVSHDYIATVFPTSLGNIGIGIIHSSSGDIPGYENYLFTKNYTVTDMAVQLSYGKMLGENLSVGLSTMYISQNIEEESASGIAISLGTQYQLPFGKQCHIGLAVQNLGQDVKFISNADPLPTTYTLGISNSIKIGMNNLLFTSSIQKINKEDINFQIGTEFLFQNFMAIRVGYRSRYSYSAGFGMIFKKLHFDYALVPYKDLNNTHQFGIGIQL